MKNTKPGAKPTAKQTKAAVDMARPSVKNSATIHARSITHLETKTGTAASGQPYTLDKYRAETPGGLVDFVVFNDKCEFQTDTAYTLTAELTGREYNDRVYIDLKVYAAQAHYQTESDDLPF